MLKRTEKDIALFMQNRPYCEILGLTEKNTWKAPIHRKSQKPTLPTPWPAGLHLSETIGCQ